MMHYCDLILGPGVYSPEKNSVTSKGTPSYSFGLRTIHEKPSQTPGTTDNTYYHS